MKSDPVVTWCVSVFDRRTRKLPLGRKWRILEWQRVPPEKAAKLRAALRQANGNASSVSPQGFEQVVQSITYDVCRSLDSSEFREYFYDVDEGQLTSELEKLAKDVGFTSVPFDPEYVEDETGVPTSHVEIIECIHGVKDPIIYGDQHSVLRRDLTMATNVDKWSVEKANLCSQFLEVVEHIARSVWLRIPPRVSYIGNKSGVQELIELSVPNVEPTMSILAFVRQLFSDHKQDGLFVAASSIFGEHCGDPGKVSWMNERAAMFEATLKKTSVFFDLGGKSNIQILNMFLYGAGLMHAKPHSHYREDANLAEAIRDHGRERVIAAFHFALHDIMQAPLSAYSVIRKELSFWFLESQLAKPDRVRLTDLFASAQPNLCDSASLRET